MRARRPRRRNFYAISLHYFCIPIAIAIPLPIPINTYGIFGICLFIYVLCCVGDADDSVANSGCGHDNV